MKWNINGIALEVVEQCIDQFEDSRFYSLYDLYLDWEEDVVHDVCFPLETGREFKQRGDVKEKAREFAGLINSAADQAANDAIRHCQERLEITTGDFAGVHFSGQEFKVLLLPLYRYMLAEMKLKEKGG